MNCRFVLISRLGWLVFAGSLLALGQPDPLRAEDASAEVAFFEQHVRPLLIEHCYECHADQEQSGGLRLDSQAAWQAGGDSGPVIVAGDPERSRLIEAVRYTNLDLQMPPEGKLSSAQIAALEAWVARGAVDPRQASPPSDEAPASLASGMSLDEGRQFWSMQAVGQPPIPPTQAANWPATAVDAFLLAELEAHQLAPAPPADRRGLIRRASLDLIGVPPTPEEIEAFVSDPSPDAFSTVVERLLASPLYGQRWGRHWLDVARYADSNGLDENLAFGNAWRYRDYVVDAFNDDKPFDRFLVEQLAGDLLPSVTDETLTATGFLMLGAKVLAEPDRDKLFMDTVDEQVDTTGKAFLGMTFGCARCHDHKFDPIRQADYYALAAIFKSTQTFDGTSLGAIKHWHEHPRADASQREQLQPVEAEIAAKKKAASDFKAQAMSRLRSEALEKAPEYFAAASCCDPQAGLNAVRPIAEEYELHPRILHHLRRQLELRRDVAPLAEWHTLVASGAEPQAIAEHFRQLRQATPAEGAAAESTAPAQLLEALLPKLLVVPVQPEFAFDPQTLEAYYALMEQARIAESHAPDLPSIMGVRDGTVLTSLPIHIRGSHRNLGPPVARGFPAVMAGTASQMIFPRWSSGRLELAQWMASGQHPLTARVYVNRVWRWHFGRGLVATTENFGALGERPSHPQLLDWLARYFVESGWSTKQLHRLLMSSRAYQMASSHPDEERARAVDPENRLLWKFRRQRMEAEQLRDAVLAVAGRLDYQLGGKMVPLRNRQFVFDHTSRDYTQYTSLRRALYLPVIRNNIYTLLEQFDFPDATMPTGHRQMTVVAPQALLMLNDELVMDAAYSLAGRVCQAASQVGQRVDWAYQITLGRPAQISDIERAEAFLKALTDDGRGSPREAAGSPMDEQQRWALFCHALLASNEFITID